MSANRDHPDPIDVPMFVGGESVTTNAWIERENPTHPDRLVGRVSEGDSVVAARAVESAAGAAPSWAVTPFEQRARLLADAAGAVESILEDVAPLLCRELGKVIADCHGEIGFAATYLRYSVDAARRVLAAPTVVEDELGRMEVVAEPYGVVSAVTPWNAPIILALLKAGPALATGNTMVVKPSPVAPLAVTQVLTAIAQQLPAGVLNVVHGHAEVGRVLTGHDAVAKVAFTGGLATGQAIMRNAAESVKPLVLELGGNDAAIFLDDADLSPAAIERAVNASFITSGQVCMAAKRVYVHASRFDEFVSRYLEVAASALVVGDPMDPTVTVGPLATRQQADHVHRLVADAHADGCQVHDLGVVRDRGLFEGGYFVRPTLVSGAKDDASIVRDEQFGPTVPVLTFEDDDEVVARANDSDLGLGSSVWSVDEDRAFALARRLEAGFTFVNTHNRSGMALRAPFGGIKRSGFGREYGEAGVREYLRLHTINAPSAFRPGADGGSGAAYPGG